MATITTDTLTLQQQRLTRDEEFALLCWVNRLRRHRVNDDELVVMQSPTSLFHWIMKIGEFCYVTIVIHRKYPCLPPYFIFQDDTIQHPNICPQTREWVFPIQFWSITFDALDLRTVICLDLKYPFIPTSSDETPLYGLLANPDALDLYEQDELRRFEYKDEKDQDCID